MDIEDFEEIDFDYQMWVAHVSDSPHPRIVSEIWIAAIDSTGIYVKHLKGDKLDIIKVISPGERNPPVSFPLRVVLEKLYDKYGEHKSEPTVLGSEIERIKLAQVINQPDWLFLELKNDSSLLVRAALGDTYSEYRVKNKNHDN